MILVLDVENTVTRYDESIKSFEKNCDNTPYNPNNRLVSVGYQLIDPDGFRTVEEDYFFFYHNELTDEQKESTRQNYVHLGEIARRATVCVGHNLKHDLAWLRSVGIEISCRTYDTMLAEYILARGQKVPLSLKECSDRYGLSGKKTDLINEYWDAGIGYEAIPLGLVAEYGRQDVQVTKELLQRQCLEYYKPENRGLLPVLRMTNEYMDEVIFEIEKNGIAIDFEELDRLEKDYRKRYNDLMASMTDIVAEYMGDTKVNLDSPAQLSELIYSRTVTDKVLWSAKFNIGMEQRGASMKPKRRPNMKDYEFAAAVRSLTQLVRKTKVEQCGDCHGRGSYYRQKQDGNLFARSTRCKTCQGEGVVYRKLEAIGGFKLSPINVDQVSASGFATDTDTLKLMILIIKDPVVVEFLKNQIERNAISTYLETFIAGIRKFTKPSGLLHPQLLQTVAATGRLASRAPNMHNQPRSKTFPIRGAFISRWEGGEILELDYKGLEYRVAVDLAHDEAGYHDITTGVDAHSFTASHVGTNRQDAKPHTFAPLYGAMPAGKPPAVANYYIAFMAKHQGIAKYQQRLQDEAIATKKIRLPSGREYSFPGARRTATGGSTSATAIKNYPVQGFATADVVPCGGIRLRRALRKSGCRSLLILTVHDSFVIDVYPGERELVLKIAAQALRECVVEVKERFNYDFWVPIDIEAKGGSRNWRDGKELPC